MGRVVGFWNRVILGEDWRLVGAWQSGHSLGESINLMCSIRSPLARICQIEKRIHNGVGGHIYSRVYLVCHIGSGHCSFNKMPNYVNPT